MTREAGSQKPSSQKGLENSQGSQDLTGEDPWRREMK
jgi:hypothetical protein